MLLTISLTTFAISLVSLVGLLFFSAQSLFKKNLSYLISLSVGTFLGVVFINLIPEALELSGEAIAPYYILGGFLGFLILSHFISVYHHHNGHDDHTIDESGLMILVGDFFHNLVDGVTITAAFMIDIHIGIATAIGVLLHELPQEIAEFFVLVRAGFSRVKALVYNFIISLSVFIGAILSYFFLTSFQSATGPLLGIAAGNLLYIAASDLLPDIFSPHSKEKPHRHIFMLHFTLLIIGILLIAFISGLPIASH